MRLAKELAEALKGVVNTGSEDVTDLVVTIAVFLDDVSTDDKLERTLLPVEGLKVAGEIAVEIAVAVSVGVFPAGEAAIIEEVGCKLDALTEVETI